jgi:YegS/Rv2252/BmrU family lipid kinase
MLELIGNGQLPRAAARGMGMTEPEFVVIVNPAAAGGKTMKSLTRIHGLLKRIGRPYAIYITKGRGDAIEAAKSYAGAGAKRILSVGGDGTLNEVANGIYQAGGSAALGLVPVGHGSDFARTVGSAGSVEGSVLRACEGEERPIDLGLARYADGTERAFINIAGLGFDARVAQRAQRSRLPGSNLPYLGSALATLVGYRNINVTITTNGQTIETPAVFVQIANARYMGGGYHFAPMARIDDGLLDVCVVGDFGKLELVRQIPGVYRGKHVTNAKFSHLTATRVQISTAEPAIVQLDGELVGSTPLEFEVLPAAIRLVQ